MLYSGTLVQIAFSKKKHIHQLPCCVGECGAWSHGVRCAVAPETPGSHTPFRRPSQVAPTLLHLDWSPVGQSCSWKSGGMLKSPLTAGCRLKSPSGHGVSREKAWRIAVKKSQSSARARPSPRQTRLPGGGGGPESAVLTSGPTERRGVGGGRRGESTGTLALTPTGYKQSAPFGYP